MVPRWTLACVLLLTLTAVAAGQPEQPSVELLQVETPPTPVVVSEDTPVECRPLGLWWLDTSAELAWVSSRSTGQPVRLRPPDFFGNTVPGLNIAPAWPTSPAFQPGIGVRLGRWLDEDRTNALEVGGLFLPGSNREVGALARGTLVYFPAGPDQSAPLLLRLPESMSGFQLSFPATASTSFATLDADFRAGLLVTKNARLDLLFGYRFAYLEDELYLGKQPSEEHDEYRTNRMTVENTFHGGELGLSGAYHTGTWYTSGGAKVAYGAVTTKSAASGAFLFPESPVALRTDTRAAWLPTFNFRLGYRLTSGSSLYAGYNFLYLSRASRFDDALASGGTSLPTSAFWVQSLSLGFDLHY